MIRDLPQPGTKPKAGDKVMDAVGNKYVVLSPGLKYASVRNLKTGEQGLVKFQELFPAPPEGA